MMSMLPPPTQPFPLFYVIRPDLTAVPLLAMDELPAWLQVGNWDWTNPANFHAMAPASPYQIPRLGEYDVICHYCSAGLDVLHKSISQQSDNPSHNNVSTVDRKSYPGATHGPPQQRFATYSGFQHHSAYAGPSFQHNFQNPYVGFCFLHASQPASPLISPFHLPPRPAKPLNVSSDPPLYLNPEARDFTPSPELKPVINTPSSSSRDDEFRANMFSPNSGWTSLSSNLKLEGRRSAILAASVDEMPGGKYLGRTEDKAQRSGKNLNDMVSNLKQVLGIIPDQGLPDTSTEKACDWPRNDDSDKSDRGQAYTGGRTHGHPSPRRGRVRVRHPARRNGNTSSQNWPSRTSSFVSRSRHSRKMRWRRAQTDRMSRYRQIMQNSNWRVQDRQVQ